MARKKAAPQTARQPYRKRKRIDYRPVGTATDEDYQWLAWQVTDRDEKAAKEVSWAAKWRLFHPATIDPATVPSRTAVTLLQLAQQDLAKFIELFARLLPTRQHIDAQERFNDDGQNALDLVFAAQQEFESAEGPGLQLALSPEDLGIGSG